MSLSVKGLTKQFGDFVALDSVDLTARPGEFLALLGPSGSGKTTLLRIMAGLEKPDAGQVLFEGEDVTDLPVARRGVGFVFQHYALFRHMSIAANIAFGLTVRPRSTRPSKAEIAARVEELLELVHLPGLGKRYPDQLSGGQRQRVALARALAVEPRMLLLDEPFGALDARVRRELRQWLRQLHDRMGLISVFVTHDQEEALDLADRVVVMDHGNIAQVDTPEIIYREPASPYVFQFVGEANRVPVTVAQGQISYQDRLIDLPLQPSTDGDAELYFRPHDVKLSADCTGCLPMLVSRLHSHAAFTRVEGMLPGLDRPIEVDVPELADGVAPGRRIGLVISRARLFPR